MRGLKDRKLKVLPRCTMSNTLRLLPNRATYYSSWSFLMLSLCVYGWQQNAFLPPRFSERWKLNFERRGWDVDTVRGDKETYLLATTCTATNWPSAKRLLQNLKTKQLLLFRNFRIATSDDCNQHLRMLFFLFFTISESWKFLWKRISEQRIR